MLRIIIEINDIELTATISNNKTGLAIYNALPFNGIAQRWGDQILFDIPVKIDVDNNATRNVEVGDIAYCTMGSIFCIFFGRTPFSTGKKPKAFNLVNIFGKIEGNVELLKGVNSQSKVHVKRLNDQKTDKVSFSSKSKILPLHRASASNDLEIIGGYALKSLTDLYDHSKN